LLIRLTASTSSSSGASNFLHNAPKNFRYCVADVSCTRT